jgi:ABC-type uncharacterized transport system involved in gliding motility auxiliary subunit
VLERLKQDAGAPLKGMLGGLTSRSTKRRANAWVYTAAVVGILVLLNVIAARFPWRFDATKEKAFTLADQTREVLAKLPGEVKALGFYTSDSPAKQYMVDLLQEYALRSKGKFTWEVIDPATNPSLVQQYGVTADGTTVLVYGTKQEKLDQWDLMGSLDAMGRPQINGEQALTNALIRLTANRTPKAYFMEGHGEEGYDDLKRQLKAEGYGYESLNFATKTEVPADADLLVVGGPARDYAQREIDLLQKWMDEKGGKVLVMLTPGKSLPTLEGWLKQWGVTARNDIVVDPERHYMYDATSPVPTYRYHQITSRIDNARLAMVIPGARSLAYEKEKQGFRFDELLVSSDKAWGETTLKGTARKDPEDQAGPLVMALAVTRSKPDSPAKPEARLVVVGSSAFAAGDVLQLQGNLDFAMAALGWLADRGESVTIRARETFSVPMFLTNNAAMGIFVGTVLVLPLLFLVTGGVVWYRRRHL